MAQSRPPRPIKVCVVAPSLDILGGQSVQADRLMSRLRELPGLEVGFIPVNPRLPGPLRGLQRIKYVRTVVTSLAYFVSLLRRIPKYDVVHAFSASYLSFMIAPVPAMLVARLYGKRVMLNYHSGHATDHFRRWPSATSFARLAHTIIVPSGYLAEAFKEFGLRAGVVFNFIDEQAFPFEDRRTFAPVYLTNRTFEPGYNVSCVLRAFGRIQRDVPEARLIVAGFGSQQTLLQSLATELGLRNVDWPGRMPPDEMASLYARADFYLNAPNVDNMPLSVLEANMCGVPVVTTNAGGIPFIVEHDVTGWMVPCDDDAALAEGALTLLRDQARAQRIARQARAVCEERYVWSAVGPKWLRAYRDLAGVRDSESAPAHVGHHGAVNGAS